MNAIIVENLHKKFKVFYDKGQTFKEKLLFRNRNYYENRWVLRGISFSIAKGEAVGLIGENGSGKSTMLKLLTRIIYPEQGKITMNGRVSSLIELGAGFHPDMSGRENIYTNASIFGLSRKEIDARVAEIIDFSELGEFIDTPVRTYSSGMYMRLAFSVAINVDADILLIDEILAVGDASFQAKCFNKLREIKRRGTTVVIVSHALGQIEQFCDRAIWIDHGLIQSQGTPREVIPQYLNFMGHKHDKTPEVVKSEPGELRVGNRDIEIMDVRMLSGGEESYNFMAGSPVEIEISYKVNKVSEGSIFGVGIFRNDGVHCYGTNTFIDAISTANLGDAGKVRFVVEKFNLLPSEYTLDVAIHTEDGFFFDSIDKVKKFSVFSNIGDIGVTRLNHLWHIESGK